VELWERTRTENYFAAGEAMRNALGKAKVAAPDWPSKPPQQAKAGDRAGWDKPKGVDLDDDIPF
jgi:hypothetical protein